MQENKGEARAFSLEKDCYKDIMDSIYISILENLGIKNPKATLDEIIKVTPDEDKNGVTFNKYVAGLFENDEDRKAKTSKIFEEIKDSTNISPYVKAYIAEASGDYIPYDTVLTAARMVGGKTGKGGKSLQMGCGEGKTGVLSMAAYAILTQNKTKQVFLTSSTENLAAEALDKIEFYEKVGLAREIALVDSKGITRPTFDKDGNIARDEEGKIVLETIDLETKPPKEVKKLLKEAYSSRLVISDNVTLMQDAMKGYLSEPEDGKTRELLADEADFVLLDSYRPLQRTTEMTKKELDNATEQRKRAYDILENVKRQMPEGLFVKDDSSQYVDFTKEGREKVVEAIKSSSRVSGVDLNTIYDYVYDALVVDTVYKENRDYQILNKGRKIVSEDRASGVGIDLPEGVKQALEIKLQRERKYIGEITPERKVLDTLNTQSFFKKFFNGPKHFVSGTLGVDSKAIVEELKNFGVSKEEGDIYEIPPKEKRTRDDQGKNFLSNSTEKRNAIVDNALGEINSGRPVLVGTVSEEEINELKKLLDGKTNEAGDKIRVLEYTAASEDIFKQDKVKLNRDEFVAKYGVEKKAYKNYKTLIKNESGKKDTITLGTSILGRGTTIKTSKEINKAKGIHVIIDGLHETSSRNQEQYKARTARGDNLGSTIEFFSYEDIPEEVRGNRAEYEEKFADEIYEEVYDKIDARTSGIRNYVEQFVEKTLEMKQVIDEMPNLSKEYKEQAKALLVQRAFSIKNRACGVSDKFQENIKEYEREIEAYAYLYIAKYNIKDKEYLRGGRFDEEKWLKEHNYEDIAKTHMPFSRAKENEVFKNQGIKHEKIKKEPIIDVEYENSDVYKKRSSEMIVENEAQYRKKVTGKNITDEKMAYEEADAEKVSSDNNPENMAVDENNEQGNNTNKKRFRIITRKGIKSVISNPRNALAVTTKRIKEAYEYIKSIVEFNKNKKEEKVSDESQNFDEESR